ncbi:DnaB-like helicase N-terminal domain-containing protein [Candidatus Latescibacterota bacterium]
MKENEIPQSPDIERTVLGEMIFENGTIPLVINAGEDLFYKTHHQLIFKAIDTLYTENGNIDQLVLLEQLRKDGNLDSVGGEATIAAICSETVSAAFIEDYLKILKEKAVLRKLLTLGKTVTNECYRNDADSVEIINIIEVQLFGIKEGMADTKSSIADQVKKWIGIITNRENL